MPRVVFFHDDHMNPNARRSSGSLAASVLGDLGPQLTLGRIPAELLTSRDLATYLPHWTSPLLGFIQIPRSIELIRLKIPEVVHISRSMSF